MYIYPQLIKISCCSVLVLFLTACATAKFSPQKIADCSVGNKCILEGVLSIHVSANGAVGILTEGEKCISLALPQKILKNKKVLNDKKVKVQGFIHSNASALGVISYTLRDREVLTGMCSAEKVMYVEKFSKI